MNPWRTNGTWKTQPGTIKKHETSPSLFLDVEEYEIDAPVFGWIYIAVDEENNIVKAETHSFTSEIRFLKII